MSADALKKSLSQLDVEQQRMMLALGILLDRIQKLSAEDVDELFGLVREYCEAESEEDRVAADEAILEILEQEPVFVRRQPLKTEGDITRVPKLENWLSWVSKRIHDLRSAAGLTQSELEERTGLPQSHISRLETGKHSPSRYTLEKIAAALGVDVSEFDPAAE